MKVEVEVVTDRTGIPIGMATDAANVSEVHLGPAALATILVSVPVAFGTPAMADQAYDSDPLREHLADEGVTLVARHRKGRKRPPTADGRA